MIDLGRVDPTQPIDLTQLTNARGVIMQVSKRHYGINLVEEVRLLTAFKLIIIIYSNSLFRKKMYF